MGREYRRTAFDISTLRNAIAATLWHYLQTDLALEYMDVESHTQGGMTDLNYAAPPVTQPSDRRVIWAWNVNGLRSAIRHGLVQVLENQSPDIVCFQEIRAPADRWDPISQHLTQFHAAVAAAERPGYSGVATYSLEEPITVMPNCFGDSQFRAEGRSILTVFVDFALLNVYMPHGSRDHSRIPYKLQAYADLTDFVATWTGQPLVVAGDFNIAHEPIDLARPSSNKHNVMFTEEEREAFGGLLTRGGLTDVYRRDHPEISAYSWWPYRAEARLRNVGWRIDYVLVDSDLSTSASAIESDVTGSDHCPVSVTLARLGHRQVEDGPWLTTASK